MSKNWENTSDSVGYFRDILGALFSAPNGPKEEPQTSKHRSQGGKVSEVEAIPCSGPRES